MKKLFVIMVFILNATFVFSQISTYKSENGYIVNMSATPNYTMFQINGNEPFSMTMSGINNGWYMYLSPTGNICLSLDLQHLMIISGNPPSQLLFKLVNVSSGSSSYSMPSTPNQYQSGRNRYQIQNDINKTQERISDNERILGDLQERNQSVTLWPTYQRLIREGRDRLYQLQRELSSADY